MSEVTSSSDIRKLETFSYAELRETRLSPGVVYWPKRSGNTVKILGPGDFIDKEYFEKFEKQEIILKIDRITSPDIEAQGKIIFVSLRNAKNEKLRVCQRDKIIKWFGDIYWTGDIEGSLLDIANVGLKVFYRFDDNLTLDLKDSSSFS